MIRTASLTILLAAASACSGSDDAKPAGSGGSGGTASGGNAGSSSGGNSGTGGSAASGGSGGSSGSAGFAGSAGSGTDAGAAFVACNFPATFGPEILTFICHADSASACEVSNASTAKNPCSDTSKPDFLFNRQQNQVGTSGKFTATSAGDIIGLGQSLGLIPSETPVTATVTLGSTNYELVFQFSASGNSVTITSFTAI